MNKRLVIIESPYASKDPEILKLNKRYARACVHDSISRYGEAPIASHLLYTQPGILDDNIPEERELGIACGLAWREVAHASIVYQDLGISRGMEFGIADAKNHNRPIEYRNLPPEILTRIR